MSNRADMIERQMELCDQSTRGFIVYRTTYSSDADWQEFIARWNATIEHELNIYNGLDVLERMNQTVMQDRELFDGATTHEVREHFQAWIAKNEPAQAGLRFCRSDPDSGFSAQASRYLFIVSVNKESLDSVNHDQTLASPRTMHLSKGWVNLIQSWWHPFNQETVDNSFEPYEPLEGHTDYLVGWMRVPLASLVEHCGYGSRSAVFSGYRRPQAVHGAWKDSHLPGCILPDLSSESNRFTAPAYLG